MQFWPVSKYCQHCREHLSGRVDKKFCDDHCRNAYHNELRRARSAECRPIQQRIARNYKILQELRERGVREVHEAFLSGKGFDHRFCTQKSSREDIIVFDLQLKKYGGDLYKLEVHAI